MAEQTGRTPKVPYYLNALRHDETKKLAPPKPGTWKDDGNFLVNYAESIDVTVQLAATEMAHSVPSVFQRPMQFYWALDETRKDPLRTAVTSEWRGLMALVGLARWMNLNLQPVKFTVPTPKNDEGSFVGNEASGDLHFRAILRNQIPLRPASALPPTPGEVPRQASDWETWWMLRCDGVSIGATSPWTLVYTAAEYIAPPGIPWQKKGVLIDPIRFYDPSGSAAEKPLVLIALHAWVKELLAAKEKGMWGVPSHLSSQETVVLKALGAWLKELARYENPEIGFKVETAFFPEAPLRNILVQIDGLKSGDGVGSHSKQAPHRSDVFIAGRKGSEVVVLSSTLPPATCVYDGLFAHSIDIPRLPASGVKLPVMNGSPIDCNYIVAEELLFPPKLVRLPSRPIFSCGNENLTVPLTPAYVEYFGFPGKKDMSVAKDGEGFTAILHIPLRDGKTLNVEKHYPPTSIVSFTGVPPAFAVWPDRYDEQWKHGFAAFSANERGNIRVKTITADGTVSNTDETACSGAGQKPACIWECSTPPIGFALSVGENDEQALAAGLVLRENLEGPPQISPQKTWHAAVDFGTSSTTVMVDRGNGAKELEFAGRTVFLTQKPASESADAFNNISANLYPSEARVPPFLTLLYDTVATVFGAERDPYTLRFASSAAAPGGGDPVRDIKWGRYSGGAATNPLMVYLTALVRYIVWEARMEGAKTLEIAWSYPLSLPVGSYSIMKSFWGKLSSQYDSTGIEVTASATGMPESEAICRALCKDRQNKSVVKVLTDGLTIAVDVGGGSTDIAFWSGSRLLDQVSFKLAGNDILNAEYLSDTALDCLFDACNRTPPAAERQQFMENALIYLNDALTEARVEKKKDAAIFRSSNPRLHPLVQRILGGHEDSYPWQQFRSMIYLFFTGLSYYLAVHARSLDVRENRVEIYFGGRGSAFLTWLHGSGAEVAALLEHAFQCGLDSASDDNTPVYFRNQKRRIEFLGLPFQYSDQYPALKTEVVRGLLRTDLDLEVPKSDDAGEEGDKVRSCVAGEVLWTLNGDRIDWGHRLRSADLKDLHYPDAAAFESTTIGHFMAVLLRAEAEKDAGFINRLSLDKDNLRGLVLEGINVHQLILETAQQFAQQGECVSQPIFAYELSDLMEQYAKKASQSHGAKVTA